MTGPFIIPFFITHQGCPHRCIYCDQRASGGSREEGVSSGSVVEGIAAGLASPRLQAGRAVEVAFYGGTFTGLPWGRQDELLAAVRPFLEDGRVHGLRLSTRPDALSPEQVEFLARRRVTTVEIGVQSFDDKVLEAAGRGHTAADAEGAAERVREAGLRLGIQLLPGLPGEDDTSRRRTLESTLAARPDDVRIYPLVVIKGTPLADLFAQGLFEPLALDRAVAACAEMTARLTEAGINVIRVGLADQPGLAERIAAGPYHPAFGELVGSELFYQAFCRAAGAEGIPSDAGPIRVSPRDYSQARGHGRSNLRRWQNLFGRAPQVVGDDTLNRGTLVWGDKKIFVAGIVRQ